ncbi:hypothetical protein HYX13_00730 [Candidatus Woesearchaeota archaeon]|nr:hypothetical protein [Candidatus Woesearchaeota archaeon]
MLKLLHSVAIMKPIKINIKEVIKEIVWGYYHLLKESPKKNFLAIPLLKTTRYFSYDDTQRQKLSKSKRSQEKISTILSSNDWENLFFKMLEREIKKLNNSINEYWSLNPKETKYEIVCGIDSFLQDYKRILIIICSYLLAIQV